MKKYRVVEIDNSFGIFLDDIVEAEDDIEAIEIVFNEIIDNIGNYIDIEVEEIEEDIEEKELDYADEYHELEMIGEIE